MRPPSARHRFLLPAAAIAAIAAGAPPCVSADGDAPERRRPVATARASARISIVKPPPPPLRVVSQRSPTWPFVHLGGGDVLIGLDVAGEAGGELGATVRLAVEVGSDAVRAGLERTDLRCASTPGGRPDACSGGTSHVLRLADAPGAAPVPAGAPVTVRLRVVFE